MPAFSEPENAMACKLVTAYPKNVPKGLPSIIATVVLFDADTGKVSALMDGTEITTWRTAAASYVATKHLHKETPKILAVLGAGTQAGGHAETLDYFYKFSEIRIWNITDDKAEILESKLKEMGKPVLICKDVEECLKNADVIVTATFSETPMVKKEWVKPGAHINAIGVSVASGHLGELEMELYKDAAIYTDSMEAAKSELQALFDAGVPIEGMAVEDVVSAKLIYEEYKKNKKSCNLECLEQQAIST
ncbi:Ketimine reductase mu-crystallin [Blattella germanica]|nr:Ketimine reductase mu-crystallin [Blattella germanica]